MSAVINNPQIYRRSDTYRLPTILVLLILSLAARNKQKREKIPYSMYYVTLTSTKAPAIQMGTERTNEHLRVVTTNRE
jgi:hypothetical protein